MRIMLEISDADVRHIGSLLRESMPPREGLGDVRSTADTLPMLLSVRKTAELLSISRSHCYELIRSAQIPSVKFGRSLRVPTDELRHLVDSLPREGL